MFYSFCSSRYVPWLTVWLRSIRVLYPSDPILVHFVEERSGDLGLLAHSDPNLRIQLPPVSPHEAWRDKRLSAEERGAIFLEARAENTLLAAKRENYTTLVVSDTDILFRRSIDSLLRAMPLYDFAAVIRGRSTGGQQPPHMETSAAMYLLNKSGVSVLEEIVHLVKSTAEVRGVRRGEWFRDQACHTDVIFRTHARVLTIPREIYLSSRPFDKDASVWNGNFRTVQGLAALRIFERELDHLDPEGISGRLLAFAPDLTGNLVVK